MESYYRKHGLTRSGQGIGGNFNGVDIRVIIKENNLQELALQLPVEGEAFLNYMRSIRELHNAVIAREYSYSRCEKAVFNFETNFWYLHAEYKLPMTLKCHVIIDHYLWYFREMGTNFHDTNGENVEALHYNWDGFEQKKNLKVFCSFVLFHLVGRCI